jgi:hypothetical protein
LSFRFGADFRGAANEGSGRAQRARPPAQDANESGPPRRFSARTGISI